MTFTFLLLLATSCTTTSASNALSDSLEKALADIDLPPSTVSSLEKEKEKEEALIENFDAAEYGEEHKLEILKLLSGKVADLALPFTTKSGSYLVASYELSNYMMKEMSFDAASIKFEAAGNREGTATIKLTNVKLTVKLDVYGRAGWSYGTDDVTIYLAGSMHFKITYRGIDRKPYITIKDVNEVVDAQCQINLQVVDVNFGSGGAESDILPSTIAGYLDKEYLQQMVDENVNDRDAATCPKLAEKEAELTKALVGMMVGGKAEKGASLLLGEMTEVTIPPTPVPEIGKIGYRGGSLSGDISSVKYSEIELEWAKVATGGMKISMSLKGLQAEGEAELTNFGSGAISLATEGRKAVTSTVRYDYISSGPTMGYLKVKELTESDCVLMGSLSADSHITFEDRNLLKEFVAAGGCAMAHGKLKEGLKNLLGDQYVQALERQQARALERQQRKEAYLERSSSNTPSTTREKQHKQPSQEYAYATP